MIFHVNFWQEQGEDPVLMSGMIDGTRPGLVRVPKETFRAFVKEHGDTPFPLVVEVDSAAGTIKPALRN